MRFFQGRIEWFSRDSGKWAKKGTSWIPGDLGIGSSDSQSNFAYEKFSLAGLPLFSGGKKLGDFRRF